MIRQNYRTHVPATDAAKKSSLAKLLGALKLVASPARLAHWACFSPGHARVQYVYLSTELRCPDKNTLKPKCIHGYRLSNGVLRREVHCSRVELSTDLRTEGCTSTEIENETRHKSRVNVRSNFFIGYQISQHTAHL